ncbi:hypothetical protein PV11_04451 [Exophiala sideris]|uniref:Uncharacterized protein n=1 Tax=Exophiala sideris TaxID=1016849 RepID=A0A0D1YHJ4_9EURO|nr:hypothetical protein PV11_04451 [Exophiala sideris]
MSKAGHIISFIIFVVVIAFLAIVGYIAYSIAHDVGHTTRQKLEKKNVSFSREGMKVGVHERSAEHEEDATQSLITKIWNSSSWPGYQSRIGWGQGNKTPGTTPGVEKRNPYSRQSSSTAVPPLS